MTISSPGHDSHTLDSLELHLTPIRSEWDELDECCGNISTASSSSFLNDLIDETKVNVEFITYNKIHLVVPLEGYKVPKNELILEEPISPRRSHRNRNQNVRYDNFGRREATGSSLTKRKKRSGSVFSLETFSNLKNELEDSFRRRGLQIIAASSIVSLQPFGTKFSPIAPAIVSIPLDIHPSPGDEIFCLRSNNLIVPGKTSTPHASDFEWTLFNDNSKFTIENGRVTFETTEFCYYLLVIREKHFETSKHIRTRIGGKLIVPYFRGVEVIFPKGSIKEDILAVAKVHLDTEMNVPNYFENGHGFDTSASALASPILHVEPHGLQFYKMNDVTIQLPIPNYDDIMTNFAHLQPKLSIWQSSTGGDEMCKWEILDTPFSINKIRYGNVQETVISFQVEHFSFFKVVWNILSSTLYEAKVGASYFYPHVSFSMKCQANMEENSETNRFGLEVICYRSDKVLPELTNYRHKIGSCIKPKLVKPGKIIIRLKSKFFEQDDEAGEDGEGGMVKEECDFRGRDFEVQYALRFKSEMKVGRGTFGKVIVKRFITVGSEEPLFEFNLQKYGCEGEKTPHGQNDCWSIIALQELAASLFITVDENWKLFAKEIGFTNKEIKANLKYSKEPFLTMLTMYQERGGTPNEFVTAMYQVNRKLKVLGNSSPTLSKKSISSQGSSGLGTGSSHARFDSDSDTTGTQISQDSVLNGSIRKRSNPSLNRSRESGSSKTKRVKYAPKPKKDSESSSGDESGDEEDNEGAAGVALSDSTSIYHQNDLTKLESTYLWEVSAHLDNLNWRNLARTLGLDEASVINIEHLHKGHGLRECAYQMLLYWKEKYPKRCTYGTLYNALCKEGMNAVAKKMKFIKKND